MRRALQWMLMFLCLVVPATAIAQESKPPGAGFDACTLISRSQIEKIMGVTLLDGKREPAMQKQGILSTCDYSGAEHGQISILLRQTKAKYVAGSEKAEFGKAGMKLRYVDDLGKTAFFSDVSGSITGLNVFRGDYDFLLITAVDVGPVDKISPNLEKLARALLERWK